MNTKPFSPFEAPEGVAVIPSKSAIGGKRVSQLRKEYERNPYASKFRAKQVRNAKGELFFAVTCMYNGVIPVFLGNAKFTISGWKFKSYIQIKKKA